MRLYEGIQKVSISFAVSFVSVQTCVVYLYAR